MVPNDQIQGYGKGDAEAIQAIVEFSRREQLVDRENS